MTSTRILSFYQQLQSKTHLLLKPMATVIPNRGKAEPSAQERLPPKNILKTKQTNQSQSNPTSKHSLSEEKGYKPNMQGGEGVLLAQKKALKGEGEASTPLRNIIQTHEEDYRQSKPFNKKYGTQNTTQTKNLPAPQSRQEKVERHVLPNLESKNKTKQSFNKKLNSNIIKDEQTPASKQSYRIKRVENRSPKKIRDDLIFLNEEEHKLQIQILQIHKSTKQQFQQHKATYKFNFDNAKKHFPDLHDTDDNDVEHLLQQVEEKLRQKKKEQAKLQAKIQANAYLSFLKNMPEDIMELHSSEQEDDVPQLPENKPRLQNNIGSYATAMPGIKDKKHALNLRRTYDIFKEDDKQSQIGTREAAEASPQQRTKQQGENKVTVNNRLKDFLLS